MSPYLGAKLLQNCVIMKFWLLEFAKRGRKY